MWLELENGELINLDLIDKVQLHRTQKKASLWTGGILQFAESAIAFRYFELNAGLVTWRCDS